MATNVIGRHDGFHKKKNNYSKSSNLESFTCIWLDENVDITEDNRITQHELRQSINYLLTFDNIEECEFYIGEITQEKIIFIVSGSCGRQIVPRIHHLHQLSAFYVYCQDKQRNEQWANKYQKCKGVFIRSPELVSQISTDQISKNKMEDGFSLSIIKSGSQSLEVRNATFLWFQLFIEVLLRMHHKSTERKEFIDICKTDYQNNEEELGTINEFEFNYNSEFAIWWYTREFCFYRRLNKALRVQDFDVLLSLRCFISDIAKQIKNGYDNFLRTSDTKTSFQVYRGQVIENDELKLIKNSIGEFISMNSFLSTSRDPSRAIEFAKSTPLTEDTQSVLFDIEIDPRLETKPFCDVSQMSFYGNESEVLIMVGALFRINKISQDDENQMCIINVSLADENDFHLKEMFSYMKTTIGNDTDFDSLGKILHETGKYEQAEKCYRRMLNEGKLVVANAEFGLGREHCFLQNTNECLEHLEQASNSRKELLGKNHPDVGECYTYLGNLHWRTIKNFDRALKYLKRAIRLQEDKLPDNSLTLANTYHNMAATYYSMEDYDSALNYYEETLKIRKISLPNDHPDVATTYNNIGALHGSRKDYSKALEYFEKAFNSIRKTLPPDHLDYIQTANNIREIQQKMQNQMNFQ